MDKITVVDMDKSTFIRRLRGYRKVFRISWAPPVSISLMMDLSKKNNGMEGKCHT